VEEAPRASLDLVGLAFFFKGEWVDVLYGHPRFSQHDACKGGVDEGLRTR